MCEREREMGRSTRVENGQREPDVNGSQDRFIFTRVLQKAAEKETKRERTDEAKIIMMAGNHICLLLITSDRVIL